MHHAIPITSMCAHRVHACACCVCWRGAAQLAAAKREAVVNEEQLTTAFTGVITTLEGEVGSLTAERDEARDKVGAPTPEEEHVTRGMASLPW